MNLHVVPYGNANGKYSKGGVTCQHGADECTTNMIEACTIHLAGGDASFDKAKGWWPFFNCMEKNHGSPSAAQGCASDSSMKYSDIMDCANGDLGKQLIDANADETNNLKPSHKYVPWVLIDGTVMSEGKSFLAQLCAAYKGTDSPKCCSQENAEPLVAAAAVPKCTATKELEFIKPTLRIVADLVSGDEGGNHYGDPVSGSCLADEANIAVSDIKGRFCSPKCSGTGTCPADLPSGCTAKPQCVLKTSSGDKFCALVCTPGADDVTDVCGKNASCKSIQGTGLCTYDS